MGNDSRWVTIAPQGSTGSELTLAVAATPEQVALVGHQAGADILLVVGADDCRRDFAALSAKGVKFHGEPKDQAWGTDVVFEDLYGNMIDLIQLPTGPR